MDTSNQSYIAIEALLSESGEFELIRGYESKTAEAASAHFVGDDVITLELNDEQGNRLYSEKVPIIFNHGCARESHRIAMAVIFKFIPRFENARSIVARFDNAEVFSASIASTAPQLSDLKMKVSENSVELLFDSSVAESGLRAFAQLTDGRLLEPPAEFDKGQAVVSLAPLKGLEEVSFVVEATRDFRSTRLATDSIELADAEIRAVIVEPVDQSVWPFGKRGSLIASVFDENGRHRQWGKSQLGWAVNGQPYGSNMQLEAWSPEQPGEYHIELIEREDNGQTRRLGETRVTVSAPNDNQLRYLQLMKDLQLT